MGIKKTKLTRHSCHDTPVPAFHTGLFTSVSHIHCAAGEKMRTKVLRGQELHNHLVANCAISDEIAWPETPAEEFSSLEKMKAHLKTGNSVQINSY